MSPLKAAFLMGAATGALLATGVAAVLVSVKLFKMGLAEVRGGRRRRGILTVALAAAVVLVGAAAVALSVHMLLQYGLYDIKMPAPTFIHVTTD